ncbi:MAG: hypothetical protein VYC03_03480 [Pseudomonadota bacterium]|nr:hypothetical protein [Pseudomonadota bacterium]MEE3369715.1 hypothetical protein [Planctomycetota bacterium]
MAKFFAGTVSTLLCLLSGIDLQAADGEALSAPKLSAEGAKFRELVVPNPSEASYRKIPWRTSILQGIVEAQKHDKPVMIYLMNGHPLGCT